MKNLFSDVRVSLTVFLLLAAFVTARQAAFASDQKAASGDAGSTKKQTDKDRGWKPLFNGTDLEGWKVTNFGGEGDVYIKKGNVVITQGVDLSGITSTRKDLPKIDYEIEFEAQRAQGNDFFAGLTFPVNDTSCSLICGGWGGGVCGISSLDGMDASENDTTSYTAFTNGQWYKVRVKVTADKIEAWLDKDQIVDVDIKGRKIDVRFEVDLAKPLGFSTFQSTAWIRNARIRKLVQKPDASPAKATK